MWIMSCAVLPVSRLDVQKGVICPVDDRPADGGKAALMSDRGTCGKQLAERGQPTTCCVTCTGVSVQPAMPSGAL